jgi:hypothetical protein
MPRCIRSSREVRCFGVLVCCASATTDGLASRQPCQIEIRGAYLMKGENSISAWDIGTRINSCRPPAKKQSDVLKCPSGSVVSIIVHPTVNFKW